MIEQEIEELSYFVIAYGEPSKPFSEEIRAELYKKMDSPWSAYERAKKSGNAVQIAKCIDDFVESNPEHALNCGKSENDTVLINKAGYALLDKSPERAHLAGVLSDDAELKEKAKKAYFESNPGYGLMYGAKNNEDVELVRAACENLLDKDPMDVILGARGINDERLVNLAIEKLQSAFEDLIDKNFDKAARIAYRTNDSGQLSAVGWRLVDEKPVEAYRAGCISGDLELKSASCLKSLKADPESTYYIAVEHNDLGVLLVAGEKLLQSDSRSAYIIALKHKDGNLLSKAREKLLKEAENLVESDVSAAFDIARLVNDFNLVSQCGPGLLDKNPEKAYKAGRLTSDNQLMDSAVEKLVQDGYWRLLRLAEEEHNAVLLRKAVELIKPDDGSGLHDALYIALKLHDAKTIESLGSAINPDYEVLKTALNHKKNNNNLLKIASWRCLNGFKDEYSFVLNWAFDAGKIIGDRDLMNAALSKAKDKLSPNVAKLVEEHYEVLK